MKRDEAGIARVARSRALSALKQMHPQDFDRLFAAHVAELMIGMTHVSRAKPLGNATHIDPDETGKCQACGVRYPCRPARKREKRNRERDRD